MNLINKKKESLSKLKKDGFPLRYYIEALQNDKEVVLASVQQDGNVLEYVSDTLKNDKEVVLAEIQQNSYVLGYASEELKIKIGYNDSIIVLKELIQIEQDKIQLKAKINTQIIKNSSNKVVKL